jgi:enoyl-CoA hydratase
VSHTNNSSSPSHDLAVTVERRGPLLLMGLKHPAKRNAFNVAQIEQLAGAYHELEANADLRCGVLFAHGEHFTAGLGLAEAGPLVREGRLDLSEPGHRDPWRKDGRAWTTPVVAAVQGSVTTLAIELLLAADIRIAASDARFAELEISRGIYPWGATIRLPREAGWGNAMRWLLTGEEFDAAEAYRIGLVQEVVEPGWQLERAIALAGAIAAKSASLGVKTTLASAHRARLEGETAAYARLDADMVDTEDGRAGLRSFVERREGRSWGAGPARSAAL